ncbi:tannase and feruloyl esterase [Xylariaceae sp. FL0016]|nr:tannase and feruloyl esterase [Xylariaceae sp. FL0016]
MRSLATLAPVITGLQLASCTPQGVPCASLTPVPPTGSSIINVTATEAYNVTVEATSTTVNICDVQVFLTHGTAGDEVRIGIWLPLSGWNGRWQGTGGSGWAAGLFETFLGPAVADGYAAGSTDAGVGISINPHAWANDTQLVTNYLHLSPHEMTLVGKQVMSMFYGQSPGYSYWLGCSNGGRQGYSEAQLYSEDYDGIYAAAPAINWDRLVPAEFWPSLVQNEGPDWADACRLWAIGNASIAACDLDDGGQDGLIGNPLTCSFDARSLIGEPVATDGCNRSFISEYDAAVWNAIRDGPVDQDGNNLWYGLTPGTEFDWLATEPAFTIPRDWITDFLLRSPGYDVDGIDYDQYLALYSESTSDFHASWGMDNPDLTAFEQRGGKLLTWHGWADELIFPQGTLDYWKRVIDVLGGEKNVDDFYRVFMAPGVGHCGGGYGPSPTDPLAALVRWVEDGEAPETLPALGGGQTRDLCKHPKGLVYKGSGNVDEANNWECK